MVNTLRVAIVLEQSTGVGTNLLYLAGTSEDAEAIKEHTAQAEIELRRVSSITNQTLWLHRTRPLLRNATVRDLLAGIYGMFAGRISNHGITIFERHRPVRMILCLDGELRQVLTNLVGNAVDADSETS